MIPFVGIVPAFVWRLVFSVGLVSGVYLYIQKTGEQKALAKVEKANNVADTRGQTAARNDGKRTRGSVRDPYTRVD